MAKKKELKQLDECTSVVVVLCNGVRKRVVKEQSEHLSKTGRYMAVPLAVNTLLRKLIELETNR